MYNDNLEEYIRNVLGYSSQEKRYDNFYQNEYNMDYGQYYRQQNENFQNVDLNKYYPEIYHLVYPMVKKICSTNRMPLTENLIEDMTDEIYYAIEDDNNRTVININLKNELNKNTKNGENREAVNTEEKIRNSNGENTNMNINENNGNNKNKDFKDDKYNNKILNRKENRQINRGLRDLIKILLLRELINRPDFSENRPHNIPIMPLEPSFFNFRQMQ